MFARLFLLTSPVALALHAVPAPATEASAAPAASPDVSLEASDAFLSLEGEWEGKLSYRDYQSDKLESIPVRVTNQPQPDGQTIVQRFDYSDPQFQVYITNLIVVADGLLTGATARAGRAFETYEKRITVEQAAGADTWTAVLLSEGEDDNRPAAIRETMVRTGGSLTVTKDVDFLDDESEGWEFRNRISLTRAN